MDVLADWYQVCVCVLYAVLYNLPTRHAAIIYEV